MSRLIFILSLALSLTACKSSQGGKGVPQDFGLLIEHIGCRGNCPDYRITVDADGNAKYEGRRAVEMMGEYRKQLDKDQMKALVSTVQQYDFWGFEDEYGGGVADLPYVRTTVTMDNKTKTVTDIRYAPTELKEMEARLENIIGELDWKRIEGQD